MQGKRACSPSGPSSSCSSVWAALSQVSLWASLAHCSFPCFLQVLDFCHCCLFFNYILYSILFCISFRYTAYWLDDHISYKVLPLILQYLPNSIDNYYNIIDYIPYAVLYIYMAILQLQTCTT